MFANIVIFAVLALAAFATAQLGSAHPTAAPGTADHPWDIAQGSLTADSVRIYSGLLLANDFEWTGENYISAVRVWYHNRSDSSHESWLPEISGGVHHNYFQMWRNDGRALNSTVSIYSRPANHLIGYLGDTDNHTLVETVSVRGVTPLRVSFNSTGRLRAVELIDQTNGTGVEMLTIDLGGRTAEAVLTSPLFRATVDYVAHIYWEPLNGNLQAGVLTERSILLKEHTITADSLINNGVTFELAVTVAAAQIDYVRLIDRSNGRGPLAQWLYIYAENEVYALFEQFGAEPLNYTLEVYGEWTGQNGTELAIEVGLLHPDSVLLEERLVTQHGTTAAVGFGTQRPIDRIEVENLSVDGDNPVRATLLAGAVGEQRVVVQFAAQWETLISFEVRVYGRL